MLDYWCEPFVQAEKPENMCMFIQSDEISELCGVHVTFYDSEGNPTGSVWYTTFTDTLQQCQAWQGVILFNLRRAGFYLTPGF